MRVLVFGGNGFLGKSLTTVLNNASIECFTVSRSDRNSNFNLDISDYSTFSKLPIEYFDAVINCATVLPGGNYLDSDYLERIYKTNILGTQNICKWIEIQHSVKKIINCSTLVVVGKPWPLFLSEKEVTYPTGNHVLYCSSKLTQELLFKTFALSKNILLTQVRFSALYGEKMNWSGLICNLIDQAKTQKKISLKNASKVAADFLYVDDAANILLAAIQKDIEGIVNGASGKETTILELATIISHQFVETIQIENFEDAGFTVDRALINVDRLNTIIDSKKFVTLEEGINKMIKL